MGLCSHYTWSRQPIVAVGREIDVTATVTLVTNAPINHESGHRQFSQLTAIASSQRIGFSEGPPLSKTAAARRYCEAARRGNSMRGHKAIYAFPHMKAKQYGFTLLELMFTIALLGTLLGLAAPSFRDFLRNSKLTSSSNDLLADLNLARTEAIKRRESVIVCSSSTAAESDPDDLSCRGTDATTFDGWFVFVDDNGDGLYDAGSDPVVSQRPGTPEGVTAKSDTGFISYASTGFLQPIAGEASASIVAFCDERGNKKVTGDLSAVRVVNLQATGRAGVAREYVEVSDFLDELGTCP